MKRIQRQEMLNKLQHMPAATYAQRSAKIVKRLTETPQFHVAKTIAVTMSNFPEVETRGFIEHVWSLEKKIVVPKSNPKTRQMTFYKITDFRQLEVVFAGIEEPIESMCEAISPEQMDLVIVPGVVFNKKGYRIGFGGGYYDRFLAGYRGATIALAFEEQVCDDIPVDAHDIPVQHVITDQRMLHCSEG